MGIRTLEQLDGLDQAAELELESAILEKMDQILSLNSDRPLRVGQTPEACAW